MNIPTLNLSAALDPGALAAWIEYEMAGPAVRRNDLMAAFQRFSDATREGIHDDAMAGRATDFVKQFKATQSDINDIRTRIKAPVLHAQRLIDGEAKKISDELLGAEKTIAMRIGVFLQKKEAAARKAAEAEAMRLAAESEAAIKAAQEPGAAPEVVDVAIQAMADAETARATAEAAPLELSRTRSALGSIAGLKDHWTFATEDISKIPAVFLTVNDVMVKAAIKSGTRDIPGIRIYNDARTMIR